MLGTQLVDSHIQSFKSSFDTRYDTPEVSQNMLGTFVRKMVNKAIEEEVAIHFSDEEHCVSFWSNGAVGYSEEKKGTAWVNPCTIQVDDFITLIAPRDVDHGLRRLMCRAFSGFCIPEISGKVSMQVRP